MGELLLANVSQLVEGLDLKDENYGMKLLVKSLK
jgi:hypothetical protein